MSTTPPELDWTDLEHQEPPDDTPIARPERPPIPETPTSDSAAQSERARVLRHPDIAARLCQPPLNHSRPEVWNGYVPPETWQGKHNDSLRRDALLGIITDAIEADKEADHG